MISIDNSGGVFSKINLIASMIEERLDDLVPHNHVVLLLRVTLHHSTHSISVKANDDVGVYATRVVVPVL